MEPRQLTATEKIALAIAFKADDITALKKSLPDGSAHDIDCLLKITGKLAKTFGKPAASTTLPADVSLGGYRFLAALLSRLKIKPEQFATEAKALAESVITADTQLISDESFPESDVVSATLDTIAGEIAAKLPTRTVESGGRAGSVSGQISVEIVEQSAATESEPAAKPAKAKATRRKAAK